MQSSLDFNVLPIDRIGGPEYQTQPDISRNPSYSNILKILLSVQFHLFQVLVSIGGVSQLAERGMADGDNRMDSQGMNLVQV